jgi:hypothetical protein
MTKHTYKNQNLIGVAALGDYSNGYISEGLRKFRDPFETVIQRQNKWSYGDSIQVGEVPVWVNVSYEWKGMKAENIVVSAASKTGLVDEKTLIRCLDDLLKTTGITELPSEKEQFEELFSAWQLASGYIRRV